MNGKDYGSAKKENENNISESNNKDWLNSPTYVLQARRIKGGRLSGKLSLFIDKDKETIDYTKIEEGGLLKCLNNRSKKGFLISIFINHTNISVNFDNILEIRQGYSTDGLQRAAKKEGFNRAIPVILNRIIKCKNAP